MVSALESGSSGPGPSLGRGTALCSWARLFTLTVPLFTLFTQVYKWVNLLYADRYYDRRWFCPASVALSILFGGSSNVTILFISVERFIGVRWPFLYYSLITTKFVFAAFSVSWASLALFASLPLFAWGGLTNDEANFCRFPLFLTTNYITALYLLFYIVPICIIVPLYVFILKASLKSIRKIHVQELSVRPRAAPDNHVEFEETDGSAPRVRKSNSTDQAARQRKSTKTVSLVVGLFIVLIMPIIVIDIVEITYLVISSY